MSNKSEPSEIEEIDESTNVMNTVQRSRNIRNLVGFWLLGLCNNYPYVIMLSAAFDLLHPDHHDGGTKDNITAVIQNRTRCNDVSTGAILLADILPSLFIKLIAPFIAIRTHARVLISIIFCTMSFLITSLSFTSWLTFLGVICAALSSGLGEVTFLSYSSFFDKNVVSTWSSGTGGAGVLGALSYASLRSFFHVRATLQIMLIMPALTALTFWIILVHPSSQGSSCRGYFCNAEMKPMLESDIDLAMTDQKIPKSYTLKGKLKLIKPLLKYMIPLGLVYFAEYFINQGLMELLYFPQASSWLDHGNQYRWYQVDYQVGVLISRSSVNIFQIKRLWILPILQYLSEFWMQTQSVFLNRQEIDEPKHYLILQAKRLMIKLEVANAMLLLMNVCYSYIPSIWIVLAIIFYEGLLGGSAYVNTFYRISKDINEDREFSMGIASLGDSIGIALAGAVSLPVHNALCKLPSYTM